MNGCVVTPFYHLGFWLPCFFVTYLLLTSEEIFMFLERHAKGDWGDLDPEYKEVNNHALANGGG